MVEAGGAPLVATRGLDFSFGERKVLAGIDLTVAPGEVVGLIGPNGSGKSTLIRIVCGVLTGYGGSVRVEGREVRDWPRRALAARTVAVPNELPVGVLTALVGGPFFLILLRRRGSGYAFN